jgi:cyanophycinase
MKKKKATGYLVPIGGAEDRLNEKKVLHALVALNKAEQVAVIPAASSDPQASFRSYRRAFENLGVQEIHFIDVRYSDEADKPEFLAMVAKADLVFFTGGDQERLVALLRYSNLMQLIIARHGSGATVAGTSAGAAAIGNPMIARGNGSDGLLKGDLFIGDGFGFINNIAFDTHFLARGRIPRLAQLLSSGACSLAVGLDEDTAAVCHPDNTISVVGRNSVTIMDAKPMTYSNHARVVPGHPVAVAGLKISFLTDGMRYDLRRRRIIA